MDGAVGEDDTEVAPLLMTDGAEVTIVPEAERFAIEESDGEADDTGVVVGAVGLDEEEIVVGEDDSEMGSMVDVEAVVSLAAEIVAVEERGTDVGITDEEGFVAEVKVETVAREELNTESVCDGRPPSNCSTSLRISCKSLMMDWRHCAWLGSKAMIPFANPPIASWKVLKMAANGGPAVGIVEIRPTFLIKSSRRVLFACNIVSKMTG